MKIQQINRKDKVRAIEELVSTKKEVFPRGTKFLVKEVSYPHNSEMVPNADGTGFHRFKGFVSLVEILPNFDPMRDKLRTITIDNNPEQMDFPLIVISA